MKKPKRIRPPRPPKPPDRIQNIRTVRPVGKKNGCVLIGDGIMTVANGNGNWGIGENRKIDGGKK